MEGRDLAKSFGVPFFESSAKSRINVEEAFYELVRCFTLARFFFFCDFQRSDFAGGCACRFEKSAVSLFPKPAHPLLLLRKRKARKKVAASCRLSTGTQRFLPCNEPKSF